MDWKVAAKVVAVLAFAVVMAVAPLRFGAANGPEESPQQTVESRSGEPDAGELLRCREIGAAALDDAACKKAWADSRRHFLEGSAGPAQP